MEFMRDMAFAQTLPLEERFLEVDPRVIEHFLKGGVGEVGYFFYQGVKVYEKGKREAADLRDSMTLEQLTFAKKAG